MPPRAETTICSGCYNVSGKQLLRKQCQYARSFFKFSYFGKYPRFDAPGLNFCFSEEQEARREFRRKKLCLVTNLLSWKLIRSRRIGIHFRWCLDISRIRKLSKKQTSSSSINSLHEAAHIRLGITFCSIKYYLLLRMPFSIESPILHPLEMVETMDYLDRI